MPPPVARGLARALAGAFRDPTVCWGGGRIGPMLIRERKVVERPARRQSKGLNENYQMLT